MKIVAVIQARIGSTRLPGKVMKNLNGYTAIKWAIDAAGRAPGVTEVVVATSTNPENDRIHTHADFLGIKCIRGPEDDVLERYRLVAEVTGADAIVRLTADCPLLDSRVIGEVIALYKNTPGCMYASNTDPATWPDGLDCEAVSSIAIFEAAHNAFRPSDRDTVTRFIARNRKLYPSATLICQIPGLHKERWVLDSPEDYEFIKAVFAEFDINWHPNYLDILDLLNRKPELRELNGNYTRNQRFFETVGVEKVIRKQHVVSHVMFTKAKQAIPFASQTFSKSHLQYPEGSPLFLSHGDGGYAFDVDGNDYVDLVAALLPNILGYCDPDVDFAIRSQLSNGISFSLATELEMKLADKLIRHIPCAEMVKFGKTGSDATSAAIRVARGFTNRDTVMVIEGGYHGWHDWAVAFTAREEGVPERDKASVVRCSSDLTKIRHRLHTEKYAAIILEPEGRTKAWLMNLQRICHETGTLLIFDEIITGFRWGLGGYQDNIGVTPDLATFGKAMANGMPLSAVVGRRDIMKRFEPPHNVFFSGTFFGETLSLAASIATIEKMEREHVPSYLWNYGDKLRKGVLDRLDKSGLYDVIGVYGDAPLLRLRFTGRGQFSAEAITGLYRKCMIESGTLIAGSHNICFAHGQNELARVLASYDHTLSQMKMALEHEVPKGIEVSGGVR